MAGKSEIIDALRLINSYRVGAVTFYKWVEEYGSPESALRALEKIGHPTWSVAQAEQEIETCRRQGIEIILYSDDIYPPLLKCLDDFPPVLYVKGNIETLQNQRSVAIVGARGASINGCNIAFRIAADLVQKDVCIVSGMARGIDTASHQGAMSVHKDNGVTIAVLGTGVDVVYPPENKDVYENITRKGCIISEFPVGTKANASNFPRRNRIISALSQGVLVVEAGLKSGSLITADYALQMGKELFAVPGTPEASKSSGTNYLIKNGAHLVENAQDILPLIKEKSNVLPLKKIRPQQKMLVFPDNDVKLSENEAVVSPLLKLITVDGVDIDELSRESGKSAAELSAEILDLELQGIVQRRSGNRVALVK